MPIGYRKIWRDLWQYKGRTVLVVLSIAVGVMALGMTFSSQNLIDTSMADSRAAARYAHARIPLQTLFNDEVVESIERLPEVAEVEGWFQGGIEFKGSLDQEWQEGTLIMLKDYENQQFDRVQLREGIWPQRDSISVEFNHQVPYGLPAVGEDFYIKLNNRATPFKLGGTVRDPAQSAPPFNPLDEAFFYVTPLMLEELLGTRNYNNLRFTVPEYSEDAAEHAVEVVEDKLVKLGAVSAVAALTADVQDPDRSQAQEFLDGFGLILVAMAAMSLFLSIFLVVNTVNAIVAGQIRQIGIMKTIGGLRNQITKMYLAGVLFYGILSLFVAVPIATFGGWQLAKALLYILNVQLDSFTVSPLAVTVQILVALLTPLIAGVVPIFSGVAIPVREAIGERGIEAYAGGWFDRLVTGIPKVSRLVILTLRNTFRRFGRLVLTAITLTAAGAIFMMVVVTGDAFNKTIDSVFSGWGFEVLLIFGDYQRVDEVRTAIEAFPNVEMAELWVWMEASAHAIDSDTDYAIQLRGVPEGSTMYQPELAAGRRLDPADGHAMLLNQRLAEDMDLGLGDMLEVDFGNGRSSKWKIVGLVVDVGVGGVQNTAFVDQNTLGADLHKAGQATVAQIRTIKDTRADQDATKEAIETYLNDNGMDVLFSIGEIENRELSSQLWLVIGGLLQLMAVLMAFVGSIGLSGTLSINVIERRREIGVMRAIGASSADIARLFIGEGLIIGLTSWLLAVPLSAFAARYFVQALGDALQFPFVYEWTYIGAIYWLIIVIILAVVASWLPARRATRISVRESLAYE